MDCLHPQHAPEEVKMKQGATRNLKMSQRKATRGPEVDTYTMSYAN